MKIRRDKKGNIIPTPWERWQLWKLRKITAEHPEARYVVTASPHMADRENTRGIMLDVILGLLPAGIISIAFYGRWYNLLLVLVTVLSCVGFEWLARRVMKRDNTITDLSAVVTGLLLAYNLPPNFPIWMAVIGAFVAIVVVKQCFGGLGHNFANPAITARIVLMCSFPTAMTTFMRPFDATATATPLTLINSGRPLDGTSWLSLFIGAEGGCLGEGCRALLLLGAIYLIARKVISPIIPVCFIGTVGLLYWIFAAAPGLEMLSGGLILGACFMATDYVTSPITRWGKVIFGVGCGVLTFLIRRYGNLAEGVSYAILLMNVLTPLIEKITYPKPFGWKKPKKEAAKA